MSLQVWLPLNGDLRNYGYSNIDITNSNCTVNDAGKIGKCYYFNGSGYLSAPSPENIKSVCFWLKTTVAASKVAFVDYKSKLGFGFNANKYMIVSSNSWSIKMYTNFSAIVDNQWTHITIVKTDDENDVLLYINGILQTARDSTNHWTHTTDTLMIGKRSSGTNMTCYINDFRAYDHCLSAAEVHEISQGLVLHYKLDDAVGFTDLIARNVNVTAYNNHGNTNNPTTITYLSQQYNGDRIIQYSATPNSSVISSIQGTLHSHGIYNWNKTFKANTKYVFWIYYKPITHLDTVAGGTASNIGGWTEIPPVAVGGGWYRVGQYRNGTVTTDKTDNIFVSYKTPSAIAGDNIIIYFASPHLIEGTTEIPPYDYPSTIIQDSSGYNHNGEILNGPLTLSTDTARYSNSVHFSATNKKIKISNFPTSGFGNSYSFSWWAKINSVSPMHWGFSDGIRLNGMYTGRLWNTGDSSNNPLYNLGTTTQVTAPTVNTWHHWVMTGNGTKCYVYQDGELWAEAKTYKAISGTTIYINGWDAGTNYSSDNYSISDFRIYCTALSADDILSLYHTAAKVDNLGGLHTFEFQEKGPNKIYKTGIIQGQEISEINGMSNLKYDPDVYIEPDGSAWVHIFHHVNPTSNKFASSDTFTTGVYKDANRWFNFDLCNYVNSWEFIAAVTRTNTDTLERYRWTQSANPLTATFDQTKVANVTRITTGYNTSPLGGLYHVSGSSWLAANNGANNNWFGATGCWNSWNGGIPGWKSTAAGDAITTGTIDIYLRIDNITTAMPSIATSTKNNIWVGHTLIEK